MSCCILIVEDELIIALDLEQRLSALGYHIVGRTSTAGKCLQMVQDLHPDLVLLDIRLGGGPLEGIGIARELRRVYDVPVLFTSGYADDATVEQAKEAEAFGFLVKPFGDHALRAAIEIAVQHHQQERRARERLRFLARASAALSSSLDLEKTLGEVASLVVPRLAVGCLVDVLEPDGSLKAILATHLHKKTQELLSRAPRLPPSELDPECGIARALASGTANVLPMSADSQMVGRALGIADPAVLAALWPMAILCVPLLVGERFTGVLSLFQTEYKSADDLEGTLIEELARRIAIAIDNARLYADAQRAIRTREDVLAIASHDLRGPLSSILLSSEVLLKAVSGPALARLELLRRSALHMRRMLDCMLSAATIEAGHLVLARSRSSVAELVREAISMFTDLAATKRLTLSFTPPAEPIELTCDHDRIVEVLANLVQNSINYTPEGGAIGVQAESSSEEVRLAVTDTGAGIPPEVLPLVFDRYRRAPGAQPRGTGLGLFIAKGIVEAHHGRIAIESMPGVGTTVSFTLPRLAAP